MFQLTRYPASIYAVCQASARFSVAHRRLPPPGPVPGGAHELVQHRAHLGLRRHGGGVAGGRAGERASERTGVGRRPGPGGRGTRGRGGGGAALSRWPPRPRGRRVGESGGGRGTVRAALLTTAWRWKMAAPSRASPRVLTLRQAPEADATRPSRLSPPLDTDTRQKPSTPPSEL